MRKDCIVTLLFIVFNFINPLNLFTKTTSVDPEFMDSFQEEEFSYEWVVEDVKKIIKLEPEHEETLQDLIRIEEALGYER